MLALSDVSTFGYYAYIALYVVFFMLDDLIIFGLAAFAVQAFVHTATRCSAGSPAAWS
ncbi:hypothetical protein [Methyloceanibacter methanicus]|uniref:hypothetical protein n=1 Tax=Methyloceanibacter methanicus TaxID=1774968 RepID=UPI001301925D|nr:hypothetical protein [Methyloceanibacter methanicus]